MAEGELEKVFVDLPGHWLYGGESLWAKHLGGNLYEICNIPFAAYGLNFGDVVEAIATSPDLKPEVQRVVKPSGRRTLRVIVESLSKAEQEPYLSKIQQLGVIIERANKSYVALDVPTEAAYDSACELLDTFEEDGVLGYETCETRLPGTFTSPPEGEV